MEAAEFPSGVADLTDALVRQRQYTLAIYADLPPHFWEPAAFPCLGIVNPPLWELAHIAWFAEFFCLRRRPDDAAGHDVPSCLAGSDALFDSSAVPHADRWRLRYPSRGQCFDYMRRVHDGVLLALERSDPESRGPFQLALAHEDMHAEALVMTLNTLGLEWPEVVPRRSVRIDLPLADIRFAGGWMALGESRRAFRFDNEMPSQSVYVGPFAMASRVVTADEFGEFRDSADYANDKLWTPAGVAWRRSAPPPRFASGPGAAMHVNFHQAEAWCRWAGRRLPTEAEWEFAVTNSSAIRLSTGHVWEWTASTFDGYPGFSPGVYRDYSAPWFGSHQVLRGGSFVTHPRLKYPQYRNFYLPDRNDMFCGFRTCALA